MATLTFAAEDFGFDMNVLFQNLAGELIYNPTVRQFEVSQGVPTAYGYGTGFTYRAPGGDASLTGGTITGFTLLDPFYGTIQIRSVSVSGASFGRLLDNDRVFAIRDLFLAGNDIIAATDSRDRFYAGAGNDRISAKGGDDTVFAGSGDDTIRGGLGNDALTGSVGRDVFVFDTQLSAITNVDRIEDFSSVSDVIKIDNAIFTAFTTLGTMLASRFHVGVAAADTGDRIIYDRAEGVLSYDRDGTGSAAAVIFALVDPGTALGYQDIVII